MNYGRQIKLFPFPQPVRSPEGAEGGAGAAAGDGGAAGGAAGGSADGAGGAAGSDEGAGGKPVERPSWLPEKFKTPEDFATSYKELERKQFSRRDELKAEALKEIEAERRGKVPQSPGDYSLEKFKLADGREVGLNEADPLVPWFQDRAHKMGLSQEQYSELVKDFIQQDMQRGPVWTKEVEALGVDEATADLRLQRIEGWVRGNAPQELYDVFSGMPATAGTVKLFEHLMTLAGEPGIKIDDTASFTAKATPDSLREMMNDPKYWRDKDPVFVKQVRAVARKVAGD